MAEQAEEKEFLALDGEGEGMDRQSDQAFLRLRSLIMTTALEPGSVIEESVIAERLNCGRTPLREALMRLAEERLVVIQPRRAVTVAPITLSDLRQIVDARWPLEGAAIRLAVERIGPQDIDVLQGLVDGLGDAGRRRSLDVVEKDYRFHFCVARASGNSYLVDAVRRLLGPAMRLTYCADLRGVSVELMRAEHQAVVDAIKSGDREVAAEAMRRHILAAKDRIVAAL